jgi:hypothetical protein
MDLMLSIGELELANPLHEARLLLLLHAFSGSDGKGSIDGLTKLAKLDFLLRYPTYLQRALENKGKSSKPLDIQPYEQKSVESKMVRYRFGPWDHRYRKLLNLLAAKGLIHLEVDGRTIKIAITEAGQKCAQALAEMEDNKDIVRRASSLKTHFDMTATGLMKFIYDTFPEILSLRSDQSINS